MKKDKKFKVGDFVKITKIPASVKDRARINTPKVFKQALGKVFRIQAFDEYGHLELQVTDRDWIWLEPEFALLSKIKSEKR